MDNDLGRLVEVRTSDTELQRRWKAVRQQMAAQKIDFLICQNCTDILGGYVKWFTDISASINYPLTVIFPREDEMVTICHGPTPPMQPNPPAWLARGVKKRISTTALPSLSFSDTFEPEKVVEEIAPFGRCRIGFVGMANLPASMYKYLIEHLTKAEFQDATELVDNIKVIKSDEELKFIRETCEIQDKVFEYTLTRISPGRRDFEVYADILHQCFLLGCTQANIMVGSAPPGKPAKHLPKIYANRTIMPGDHVGVLIEANGTNGQYGEIFRIVCLGKIPDEAQRQFELALQAQKNIVDLLKPGASCGDIWDSHNALLRKAGYPEETRLLAHGQGYDMVERPSLGHSEPMKIKARMNIAVHPAVWSDKAFGHICDNYVVTEKGKAERLSKTAQKIFTI